MEAIKRIISRKSFKLYNIPESFGEEAEILILPFNRKENFDDTYDSSINWVKLQAGNGSMNILNEPEEEAWNEL